MLRPWYYYAIAVLAACALYVVLRAGGPLLVAAWLLMDAALHRRETQHSSDALNERQIHLPTGSLTIRSRLRRVIAGAGGAVVWSVVIARLQRVRYIPDNDFVGSIWLVVTFALAFMAAWHASMALVRYSQGEQ